MKTLLIVDAHAMAYRAFYALQGQNMTNSKGQPTAAIFGFFRMLFRALMDHKPDAFAVAWDSPGPGRRKVVYKEYKATRKPMPDDLRPQIDEIKELCKNCGFINLEIPTQEADDVMGSLAARFSKGGKVLLLSGDKDCYQLLNDRITMLRGAKGVTEFTKIDPDWVKKEIGVLPKQIPDYMAIVGDTSDNIPGAKGIGPKGAQTLIEQFGSIEKLYKGIDKVENKSMREKLIASKDSVILSKDLATIQTEIPEIVKLDLGILETPDYLSEHVLSLFRMEGFNGVFNELKKAREKRGSSSANKSNSTNETPLPTGVKGEIPSKPIGGKKVKKDENYSGDLFTEATVEKHRGKYTLIQSIAELKDFITVVQNKELISFDTETTSSNPMEAKLVGIGISFESKTGYYIALPPKGSAHETSGIAWEDAKEILRHVCENPNIRKIGQNIKYDYTVIKRHGLELQGIVFDTMIASYLLMPNVRRHNLDDMAFDHLGGYDTIKYEEIVGTGRNKKTMDQVEPAKVAEYAGEDADICFRLYEKLSPSLEKQKLSQVNQNIEIPLLTVLAKVEMNGVTIDTEYFTKLSNDYAKILAKIEKTVFKEVGFEFNINSTKEIQKILFEDLNLPRGRKTKTGYSTDQGVLEELRGLHPVVDQLLQHRKYSKLKSTYVDALPALINPETKRIHTSFTQTIAATGRLSSNEPNLQNIPVREDTGRAIRKGFIAANGNTLLSLDYSQIELRIMAHYSEDDALIEAFTKDNIDIHARTAASLFDIKESEVTPDMRAKAKVVNFSIIYGVTEFGLSDSLSVSRQEAAAYIDRFFNRYPGVRRYMDDTIRFAEKNGYVTTLSGRQRQIEDISSSNRFRREGAKRAAINTPIQGTSADIIKLAMIEIQKGIESKKLVSRMILQVHDELLFDVIPKEKDEILHLAKSIMEGIMPLKVDLKVDFGFGHNWDESH